MTRHKNNVPHTATPPWPAVQLASMQHFAEAALAILLADVRALPVFQDEHRNGVTSIMSWSELCANGKRCLRFPIGAVAVALDLARISE
jgi:hypothetical protein